jgi:hypothetical protein
MLGGGSPRKCLFADKALAEVLVDNDKYFEEYFNFTP